jgi:two-component system, NarL family, sensor histidine kinase DesK
MTAAPARPCEGDQTRAAGLMAFFGPADPGRPVWQRQRYRWLFAAFWLVYLAQPSRVIWHDHDLVRRYIGLAALLAFAVLFVGTLRQRGRDLSLVARLSVSAAAVALVILVLVIAGEKTSGLLVYLAVMMVLALRTWVGWLMVALIVAASLAVPSLVPGWSPASLSFSFEIFLAAVAAWGVSQLFQRNMQLAVAREEMVRVEERNRFARDLHDILGHSLTVVAIKAELAGRLARAAPERAEAEIADVERIAREALADVRAAAAGYREVTLASELASARTALTAAGIQADLPAKVADIAPRREQVFGWAIREGVTNVVRHSGATCCSVRVAGPEVEISDDGRGPAGPAAEAGTGPGPGGADGGHGLAGLRERAAAAGGSVSVGRSAAGGFALRIRVP